MGAVLQQRAKKNTWQPLAFFSRKQQNYSAYDRELLAIYEAVKHFRHMLEARHFSIFTDHQEERAQFAAKMEREQTERRNLEFQMDISLKEKEGHYTRNIKQTLCTRWRRNKPRGTI
jgi:cleavage and polyadenylation specificity factor subunit 1